MDGTGGMDGVGVGLGWDGGNAVIGIRNGNFTIGYWGEVGSGKQWLVKIALVLQGRRVFVSEQKNNTNRLHIN